MTEKNFRWKELKVKVDWSDKYGVLEKPKEGQWAKQDNMRCGQWGRKGGTIDSQRYKWID